MGGRALSPGVAVLYYKPKTGFSDAILPNVDRSGRDMAGICCCMEYTCGFLLDLC